MRRAGYHAQHRHADRHGGDVAGCRGAAAANTAGNCRADFPQPAVPADNPMSDAKVALGARLFADPRLSVNGSYSCQSCHAPERAFTDGRARSRGVTGAELALNAPTLLNAAYNASLGWNDAGILTLEQQMRGPLFNQHPPELGLAGRESLGRTRTRGRRRSSRRCSPRPFPDEARAGVDGQRDPRHRRLRAHACLPGIPPSTAMCSPATTRRWMRGRSAACSCSLAAPAARAATAASISRDRGWIGNTRGPRPSSPTPAPASRVRVPTLRNLPASAPYMHDGRFATLDAVLDHYERLAADPAADRAPAARATNYRGTRGAARVSCWRWPIRA